MIKAIVVLLPLLGLTWIIGIVTVNNDTQAFAWIFAILNSLQVTSYLIVFLLKYLVDYILGSLHFYIPCAEKQACKGPPHCLAYN